MVIPSLSLAPPLWHWDAVTYLTPQLLLLRAVGPSERCGGSSKQRQPLCLVQHWDARESDHVPPQGVPPV